MKRTAIAVVAAALAVALVVWAPRLTEVAPAVPVAAAVAPAVRALPPMGEAAPEAVPVAPSVPEATPRQTAAAFWWAALQPTTELPERWPALKQAVAWELRSQGVDPQRTRQAVKRWWRG